MSDSPVPSPPNPPPRRNAAKLGILSAIGHALISRDLDFYPRVDANGVPTTLVTDDIMAEIGIAAAGWEGLAADPSLETALALARQSLDEVKEQTEYQDQKAGRLLTVTTFLTALSGVLFTRFNDTYPLSPTLHMDACTKAAVLAGYLAFALFIMTALFGALVTFHATRTRFKYKEIEMLAKESGIPKSRLFYSAILGVRPRAWVMSFVGDKPAAGEAHWQVHAELQQRYLRDIVGETYLVAAKTADKLRYLEPAQSLLAMSLRFLILWLVLLASINALVPSTKPGEGPVEVRLLAPGAAAPHGRSDPAPPSRPPGVRGPGG